MSSKPEEKTETQEKEQAKLALEALEGESGMTSNFQLRNLCSDTHSPESCSS